MRTVHVLSPSFLVDDPPKIQKTSFYGTMDHYHFDPQLDELYFILKNRVSIKLPITPPL